MSARGACIAALVALPALACRAPASSDRLEGRWTGIRAEGVSPEALAAANAFATSTALEFQRNENRRHDVEGDAVRPVPARSRRRERRR